MAEEQKNALIVDTSCMNPREAGPFYRHKSKRNPGKHAVCQAESKFNCVPIYLFRLSKNSFLSHAWCLLGCGRKYLLLLSLGEGHNLLQTTV